MATNVENIRLLMGSVSTNIYSDPQLQQFLDLTPSGSVKLAAALGLDSLAANKSLVAELCKSLNSTNDDRQMPADLRAQAAALRNEEQTTEATIAIAEQSRNVFGARQLLENSLMELNG